MAIGAPIGLGPSAATDSSAPVVPVGAKVFAGSSHAATAVSANSAAASLLCIGASGSVCLTTLVVVTGP
jgi:hypothetical protein